MISGSGRRAASILIGRCYRYRCDSYCCFLFLITVFEKEAAALGLGLGSGPASCAPRLSELKEPFGVAPLQDGGFLIADHKRHRIPRFELGQTERKLLVGMGFADSGLSEVNVPVCVAPLQDGGCLVVNCLNHSILRLKPGANRFCRAPLAPPRLVSPCTIPARLVRVRPAPPRRAAFRPWDVRVLV